MARGRKRIEGASYFSIDVDFDDDVRTIRDLHGNDGVAFVLAVKQSAFKRSDVEVQVQNERLLDGLAARCLVDRAALMEMIETSFDVGFLDRTAYTERGVLTSQEFRDEMSRIFSERRRKRGDNSETIPNISECSDLYPNFSRNNSEDSGKGGDIPPLQAECSPSPSSLIFDLVPGEGSGEGAEESTGYRVTSAVALVPVKPAKPKPAKKPPGWREGTQEVRPGVYLSAEEVRKLRGLPGGRAEGDYWLAQLENAAAERRRTFTEKKNHYRTALSWRDMRLEEGKRWDPEAQLYTKTAPRVNGAAGAAKYKTAEILQMELDAMEREERERNQPEGIQ